jgi:hypothetical protein
MHFSRRRFLKGASAIVSGTALLPATGLSALVRARHYTRAVPLSDADQSVLAWVKGYATDVRLAGVGIIGKLRRSRRARTHILAEVPSAATLQAALSGALPFGPISLFTSGNAVTFTLDGTEFTIDNFLGDDFAAALDALLTRAGVTFATDGLTWDPDTNDLSDPFRAFGAAIKLVNPGIGLDALFAVALRGYNEAKAANLGFDVSFSAFRHRVFSARGARTAFSGAVARQFVEQLPDLTELLNGDQLAAIIGSPLVAGVLFKELGIQVGPLVAEFKQLRAFNVIDISDAALWLSQLLQDQIDSGTADAWGANLNHFRQTRFRAALAQARQVVRAS